MFIRIVPVLCLVLLIACTPESPTPPEGCGPEAIIGNPVEDLSADFISLDLYEYNLDGNCLEITVSASGCDGETWEVQLWGAGMIKTLPVQWPIQVMLKNEEDCQTVITRSFQFDIRPLQVDEGPVWLRMEDLPRQDNEVERVLYEY